MALIKCPECQKEISDMAKICPHCGAKAKKMIKHQARISLAKSLWKFIGIGFVGLLCLGLVGTLFDDKPSSKAPEDTPAPIEKYMSTNKDIAGMNITVGDFAKRYNRAAREYNKKYLFLESGNWTRNNGQGDDFIIWFVDGGGTVIATVKTGTDKIIKIDGDFMKNAMHPAGAIECVEVIIKALSPKMKKYGQEILAGELFEYNNANPRQANESGIFYSVINDNSHDKVIFSAINANDINK